MSTKLKAGTASSGAVLDADTTGILEFQTGSTPTTAVTINTSQNVGIGTASPAAKFEITGGGNSGREPFAVNGTNSTDLYTTYRYNTSTLLGYIGNGTGTITSASASDFGIRSQNAIAFATGGATERMRIDTSGNLLIGTTTSPPSAGGVIATKGAGTSTYFTHGSNNLSGTTNFVVYNGSNTGVYLITGQTSWSANSDERLKNITGKYETPLADISKIEPIKFTWKTDETNEPKVGVIAQSVVDVVPEAVGKSKLYENNDTEYLSVRYTELIPLLIASVQELNAKVTALEAQLGAK